MMKTLVTCVLLALGSAAPIDQEYSNNPQAAQMPAQPPMSAQLPADRDSYDRPPFEQGRGDHIEQRPSDRGSNNFNRPEPYGQSNNNQIHPVDVHSAGDRTSPYRAGNSGRQIQPVNSSPNERIRRQSNNQNEEANVDEQKSSEEISPYEGDLGEFYRHKRNFDGENDMFDGNRRNEYNSGEWSNGPSGYSNQRNNNGDYNDNTRGWSNGENGWDRNGHNTGRSC